MTIKEILSKSFTDIEKTSLKDLRKMTKILDDAAQKRVKRLYKAKFIPSQIPALKAVAKSMGVDLEAGKIPEFKLPKKSAKINEVRKAFNRVRNFLNYETSTVKGAKNFRENTYKLAGSDISGQTDLENEFWEGYNRFVELYGAETIGRVYGSDQVIEWLRYYVDSGAIPTDKDKIFNALRERLESENVSQKEKFTTTKGVQFDFFDDDLFD